MTIFSTTPAATWSNHESTLAVDDPGRIIASCLAGDESAYATLYQQFATFIYRLNYGLLQDREDAEEVLQDTFEYAFRKLNHFDPTKSSFKTWLYRIAVSRCHNKRRRKWLPTLSIHSLFSDVIPDHNSESADEQLILDAQQKAVWQALSQLSPKLRETAILRYYEDLTYVEIGQILDIPAKTAESRMRLAHKALQDLLIDLSMDR